MIAMTKTASAAVAVTISANLSEKEQAALQLSGLIVGVLLAMTLSAGLVAAILG